MRSRKSGLEKKLRNKYPQLLDIGGDTCHHAHNAAKAFCKPFYMYVEKLAIDMHNDFEWSPDLRAVLSNICDVLNIKCLLVIFLINGLSAPERANLINEALRYTHDTGVDVVSLTFDGTSSNIAAANELGANITANNLVNFFPHPVTSNPIYVILDACHMLKLVRNCLASKGSLYDGENLVNWKYITELGKLQRLQAATKLRLRHVQWYRERNKVKVAAQVLSSSAADALHH
ncbi:hypothetical protein AVEN_32978-1 [Araneus ventricosus]|uniref:DNA transposase THAP9 n=1 Tax=Araneus ventricosus TaxID=182803 RepID=A0A4Y2IQ73_ARAVE|nr:hypothetical protein AVEN_32978-1 [Araneus ventricosus]